MRVLFLCHRQHDIKIGGVAEFLQYLPLALGQEGIDSLIYTQAENPDQKKILPIEFESNTHSFSGPFLKPNLFQLKRALWPLLEFCQHEKIDLIHAQGLYRSGYIAMQIKKQLGIPYVITSHSDILEANSARIKRPSVQRRCRTILQNADAITHLTPFMEKASHAFWEASDKSTIIHNGIDLNDWKKYQNLPEKNYLFAIGRLEQEKGFQILIDSFAKLLAKGLKTSLIIAGTGSYEQTLNAQAKSLGLNVITDFSNESTLPEESLIFTGYVRGEVKKQLYGQSKLVLFATQPHQWEEPFGIVQIEAMAAGKSLVSSDIGATRYLQEHGLQAALVQAHDTDAWQKTIMELFENPILRKKLGGINLKNAAKFDWAKVGKQYANVYRSVV